MAATQEQLPFLRQLPVRTTLRSAGPVARPEGRKLKSPAGTAASALSPRPSAGHAQVASQHAGSPSSSLQSCLRSSPSPEDRPAQEHRLSAVVRLPRTASEPRTEDRPAPGAKFARARAAWLLEVCSSCALIVGFLAMALFC